MSLLKIQEELKAPKNQFNSFGKYKYRSCEDILEAVKPLCIKHECVLTISDKVINVGAFNYIEATATLKCGDVLESVRASAREADTKKGMDASQITGTASSYARKYALNGLFLIDDTKDTDTIDNSKAAPYVPTVLEKETLQDAINVYNKANMNKVADRTKEVLDYGGKQKIQEAIDYYMLYQQKQEENAN